MFNKFFDGIKFSLGILFVFGLLFGVVYAVGFHSASEIVGGVFSGDYEFNGTVNFTGSTNGIENNLHMAKMTRPTIQSFPNAVSTEVDFTVSEFDIGSLINISDNSFIIQQDGIYKIDGRVSIGGFESTEYLRADLKINGGVIIRPLAYSNDQTDRQITNAFTYIDNFTVGDVVTLEILHTEGASQDSLTSIDIPQMSIIQLG